jgi:hypothetical protein
MGEGAEANPLPWSARESEKWKKSNGLPGWADATVTREMYNLKNPTEPLPVPIPVSSPELGSHSDGKEKDLELGLPVVEATSTGPRGLKELCEAYVQDQGRLKEIEMKVEVYGWEQEKVIAGKYSSQVLGREADHQPSQTASTPRATRPILSYHSARPQSGISSDRSTASPS